MSGGRRFVRRGGAAGAADRSEAYYRKVADQLIKQIEAGTACWTQAWQPGETALPRNVATGKAYRGGNSVWLASVADQCGYQDERWGTYKQVQGLGGQVRRSEKGSAILFWQFETRKLAHDRNGKPVLDEDGKPVYETTPLDRPRSYPYTVFNAEQCNGLPRREPLAGAQAWDPIEQAERVLKESGAAIENAGKNRAYYDLRRDRIILPYKEQFPNGPARDRSRPFAARRLRGLVDPGAAGRSAGGLPGLSARAGDERLRAGPGAGERAAAPGGFGCRAGAGRSAGEAAGGPAPSGAARLSQALPQGGGGAEPLARPRQDQGDHPLPDPGLGAVRDRGQTPGFGTRDRLGGLARLHRCRRPCA